MPKVSAYTAIYLLSLACPHPVLAAAFRGTATFCLQASPKPVASGGPSDQAALNAAGANTTIESAQFDRLADAALLAMRQKAEATKVTGVAMVAFFKTEKIESWTSKMVVVGRVKEEPDGAQKGSNLLAIAYAKAAQMADTLRDSGTQTRPPMTGEFGWRGGVIVQVKTGYIIAAFSGGQSADDVAVSRAGVTRMLEPDRSSAQ